MTTLPLKQTQTFDLPAGLTAPDPAESPPRPAAPGRDRAQPVASEDAPGSREIAMLVRAALEIVRGYRSPYSLSDRVVPDVLTMLARRAELGRRLRAEVSRPRPDRRMQIGGVRVCTVNDDVVEASAVVREPGRARAVALRMERMRSGWRVVALEFG